jgi:hypothetical protein
MREFKGNGRAAACTGQKLTQKWCKNARFVPLLEMFSTVHSASDEDLKQFSKTY